MSGTPAEPTETAVAPSVNGTAASVEGSQMGEALSAGMRWSAISTVGREASRLIFTVLLARIIGPEPFGIVAQAMVYVGVVGLLLDQGFSSALIQRRRLEKDLPGAVVTVNLMIGAALSLATLAVAPLWADFMSTPQLTLVLAVLAPGLLIRAVAITPRALLLREMAFRKIGIADVSSALVGGVLGVIVAELGGSYWALVVQTLSTDVVLAALLLLGAGRWPNLRLRVLRLIVGFSGRAFAAGLLINSVSRNIDSLLIGRYLGPEPLAFYGLANRLLLLPVRLVSTTIGGVLFPAFSRLAGDLATLRTELARATRVIAVLALPAMALVSSTTAERQATPSGASTNSAGFIWDSCGDTSTGPGSWSKTSRRESIPGATSISTRPSAPSSKTARSVTYRTRCPRRRACSALKVTCSTSSTNLRCRPSERIVN